MKRTKMYCDIHTGKLLAILENHGTFMDSYGEVHQCMWGAEFDDCIVAIPPERGKALRHSIGDEVTVMSPNYERNAMLLRAKMDGRPFVNEASGTILDIEPTVITFDDCRIHVPYSVAAMLECGDDVRITHTRWTDDMQAMYDAMFGLSMASRAIGRASMADGYDVVLDWMRIVRTTHVVVDKL